MDEAQRFGRYKVTGTLGSGAMGHVYAAIDDVLGRSVAVKTLRGGATGLGARMLDERFRLEARAVAALNHPGIVQVYDIDLAAEPPYLVMERMTGPSLREHFDHGAVPANELRALGVQIARALAAAHAAGIIHRDVKPANILIAGPGAWKLADFGVAHVPDSSLTMTGQFIGSPAYAPPEALLRGQSTAAGDVFGLGATLYYGAAGRWPRADATNTGMLAPIPSVRTLAPDLPEDLIATIDQAVSMEPDRRPTAAALADALATGTPPAVRASLPAASQRGEATSVLTPTAGSPVAPSAQAAIATSFVPDASVAPPPVNTAFVPDATADAPRARAPTPPAAIQTAFVPDAPAVPTRARPRWLPWAIGAAVLAIGIVIAATRGTSTPAATARDAATPDADSTRYDGFGTGSDDPVLRDPVADEPTDADVALPELPLPPPGQFRVYTPRTTDPAAMADWRKVVDEVYKKKFDKAARRLAEWEARWGETPETRSLRQQLEALPLDD